MTYDTQGRRVLQGHPSRWEDECKALRARVAELEAATHGDFEAWYSGIDWHGEVERGDPAFLSFLHDHKSACRKAFEAGRALQKQEGE